MRCPAKIGLNKRCFGMSSVNLLPSFPKKSIKKLKIENAFEWNHRKTNKKFNLNLNNQKIWKVKKSEVEGLGSHSKSEQIKTLTENQSPSGDISAGTIFFSKNQNINKNEINKQINFYNSSESAMENPGKPRCLREKKLKKKLEPKVKLQHGKANKSGASANFVEILKCLNFMFENRKNSEVLEKEQIYLKSLLDKTNVQSDDFQKLSLFMRKFMGEEKLTVEDLEMSDLELIMFALFIIKKKFQNLGGLDWNLDSLNRLKSAPTKKTSEQNYKIIFKRFFKLVVGDFNREHRLDPGDSSEFYRVHFGEIAESLGQDWRHLEFKFVFNEYRDKRMSKKGRHSKKKFARVLKKSAAFMSLFRNYLGGRLNIENQIHGIFKDYLPIIDKKLHKMLERWRLKFQSNKNIKSRLCKYLIVQLKNDKMKLPWGFGEIRQAILNVEKLFDRAS